MLCLHRTRRRERFSRKRASTLLRFLMGACLSWRTACRFCGAKRAASGVELILNPFIKEILFLENIRLTF